MSLRVHYEILNQKGTPAFYSDIFANRPTFGFAGRVFISTDTGEIFEDTGTAWTLIADAGAGTTGTLQQVTTNGNTTNQGIVITAGNLGINTSSPGAPLDIHGTGTNAQFNGTSTNNAYVLFQNAGANKWRLGNNYNAGQNSFDFYSYNAATTAASLNGNGSLLLNFSLGIKQTSSINLVSGYSNIAADSGGFFFNIGGANNAYLNLSGLTASRTYTLPDATGTIALTSNLSSYLPLSGGTLTGNLIGTSGKFVGRLFSTSDAEFGDLTSTTGSIVLSFDATGQQGYVTSRNYATATDKPLNFNASNHIFNGGKISISALDGEALKLQEATATGNTYIRFYNSSGTGLGYIGSFDSSGTQLMLVDGSTTDVSLNGNANAYIKTAGNTRLIAKNTNNGTIVMGTADAAANSINFYGNYSNNEPGYAIYGSSANLILEFNGNTKALYLGNLGTGTLYSNSGIISNTSPSDKRLKNNIETLTYGLKDILKIRPVCYTWKNDKANQGTQFGFIAQEVQEIMPDAIKEFGTDEKYLGLEKDAIYSALINAIKELNEKLERNNIN